MNMRAYYSDTIKNFLEEETNSILGKLTSAHSHRHLEIQQTNAWKIQIQILKEVFKNNPDGMGKSSEIAFSSDSAFRFHELPQKQKGSENI